MKSKQETCCGAPAASPTSVPSCCGSPVSMPAPSPASAPDLAPVGVDMKQAVRRRYASAAQTVLGKKTLGCCDSAVSVSKGIYDPSQLGDIPADAVEASLGCGNPTLLAQLNPGEIVLDLGSGGGIDVLLSARRVGPTGFAYGVDMTDEMLELARKNQAEAGVTNVAFLKGEIENLPLPDGAVDVVISNCVINLSVDKDRVFKEIFRVLRPGGRMAVSDMVFTRPGPEALRRSVALWSACVAGALTVADYRAKMEAAGFTNVTLDITREIGLGLATIASASIKGRKPSPPTDGREPVIRDVRQNDGEDAATDAAGDIASDVATAKEILTAAHLPLDGLQDTHLLLAELGGYGAVGTAGFELHGPYALLRSVAVRREFRSQGLGKLLVDAAIGRTRAAGATKVYLLTDTAEKYYQPMGFSKVARAELPAELGDSAEVRGACPVSATSMVLEL